MDTAILYLPEHKFSDKALGILDNIRLMLNDLTNLNIVFQNLKDGLTVYEQVTSVKNALVFVSLYESIYLEKFHNFRPLFKIKTKLHDNILVIPKKSNIRHLKDLASGKVLITKGIDHNCVNPVILYLLKNCELFSTPKSLSIYYEPSTLLDQLLKGDASAILTNTFNFDMWATDERKKLKTLGKCPGESDIIALGGPELNVRKLKKNLDVWLKGHGSDNFKEGFTLQSIDKYENTLLIEAIEGLGYKLKEFIENYPDLIFKHIKSKLMEEDETLNEKYNGLQVFNERLVDMYKEIRESHDRLYEEIDSAIENQILFLKDGTIIGTSRGFMNWVNKSRPEIIGKNISDFIHPNINKPFNELIQQVDYGLIKSFGIRLKNANNDDTTAKMDFTILELRDSKVVMGTVSNVINR
ncbi:MAG TPA: PAS domain-containing protein [Candidatus Marinimicrobia bacterium]|nr:PAS domain-containing protein [Candidatus Neomarinimicrobiota bacterium]HRU91474.1 PAS domain-containing protein [Candidatus Neomarinimicrobiota bacterium]